MAGSRVLASTIRTEGIYVDRIQLAAYLAGTAGRLDATVWLAARSPMADGVGRLAFLHTGFPIVCSPHQTAVVVFSG